MSVVDPFATPGLWVVVTASGAGHLIDSRDPDTPVTVTRLTNTPAPMDGFTRATLRRDGTPLNVIAIRHIDHINGRRDGIATGVEMWLVLEPLNPDAQVTVRRTTPVVCIDAAPDDFETLDQAVATGD